MKHKLRKTTTLIIVPKNEGLQSKRDKEYNDLYTKNVLR